MEKLIQDIYVIVNTYEFWALASAIGMIVIFLWKLVARRKNIPIPFEVKVSETLESMQDYAQAKAEYLKMQKESKALQTPQNVLDANRKDVIILADGSSIIVENGEVKSEESKEETEDEEGH